MKLLKRILKWTGIVILALMFISGVLLFVGYWTSTNECDSKTGVPANPMKAIRYCEYGSPDVVRFDDVEKPVPTDKQVLLKVRAASLNALDTYAIRDAWLNRLIFGLRKPKDTRLGRDVAGVVEAVGKNVTEFKPGDEVFGLCRGSLAEYAVALERGLVIKPPNVTFEQAASLPIAGLTAIQGLRDVRVVDACRGDCLPLEARDDVGNGRQLLVEDLERHLLSHEDMLGEVHAAHPALAQ